MVSASEKYYLYLYKRYMDHYELNFASMLICYFNLGGNV